METIKAHPARVTITVEEYTAPTDLKLVGTSGADSLVGLEGNDTISGLDGNDTLTGSSYGDEIFGGDGQDFVNGGFGHDRVNGGDGADEFYHLGIFDHGSDRIQDYSAAAGDVLQSALATSRSTPQGSSGFLLYT